MGLEQHDVQNHTLIYKSNHKSLFFPPLLINVWVVGLPIYIICNSTLQVLLTVRDANST